VPERDVCPECESVSIERNVDDQMYGDASFTQWRCNSCLHAFEKPDTRQISDNHTRSAAEVLKAAGFDGHATEATDAGGNE